MIFHFDQFQADETTFRLSAGGTQLLLEPKALRLLFYLLHNSGRLVRKQELLDALWEEATVTEGALTRVIGILRKALDDDSREPRFIETVPTAGYRFIAEVRTTEEIPHVAETLPVSVAKRPPRPLHGGILLVLVLIGLGIVAGVVWLGIARLHRRPIIRSLAVLPLANLSGDPGQDYFADGMTDELITELAKIPNLRVVSRTSVLADKDERRPLPAIAEELGVDAVVEGSTVRSGDRVRITAQLIDAKTDRHLWAQSFEGPAADVLVLQDSVAQQIAAQARLVLLPSMKHALVNPLAHDAYLRGLYFFHKQDFQHSTEYFQQAISIDPRYAPAWAGYATALDAGTTFSLGTPNDLMPKALAFAQRAIQLDPENGAAYTALGSIQTIYSWDWAAAEQNLTRGIALDPNDPIAEFKYAVFLDAVGHAQEAVVHMRRALQLDPFSFLMTRRLGATLYLARDDDAALAQLNRAAEMEDESGSVAYHRSLVYEQMGMRDQAIEDDLAALKADRPDLNTATLRTVYRQHGWEAYWRARNRVLLAGPAQPCTAYQLAVDDLRVNNPADAFTALNHALDAHCFNMALIRVDPLLDSVRQDPRYAALLKRMHP